MLARFFWLFCLLGFITACQAASPPLTQKQLLPADVAFRVHASSPKPNVIELRFNVASGYYLYQDKLQFKAHGFTLNLPPLPAGEIKQDEFFGRVTIYRNAFSLFISVPSKLPADATLTIRTQGCADVGVCYPPATQRLVLAPILKGEPQPAPAIFPFSTSHSLQTDWVDMFTLSYHPDHARSSRFFKLNAST